MRDLFYTHWKGYNSFIDYYFIDYGLRLFYDGSASFKKIVDRNAIFTENLYVLQNNLNKIYDSVIMKHIIESTMFCKLTWKGQMMSSINGKQTFYGHLISEDAR